MRHVCHMAMSHRQSMAQLHRAFGIVRIVPMTFGIVRIVAMTSFVSSLVSIDYFMRLGAAMRLMFGFWPVCIAAMTSFDRSFVAGCNGCDGGNNRRKKNGCCGACRGACLLHALCGSFCSDTAYNNHVRVWDGFYGSNGIVFVNVCKQLLTPATKPNQVLCPSTSCDLRCCTYQTMAPSLIVARRRRF